MRYVLEGKWSGYTPSQQRVVHREIISKTRAEALRKMHGIRYTDGTMLYLSVREAKPREKITEVPAYRSLIRKAQLRGGHIVNVADLPN